jgi:cell wall-associated NlpC family hydrolase
MKKHLFLIVVISLLLPSCFLSKNEEKKSAKSILKTDKIIANAMQYKGVSYRFGGTTKKGMDCSGVVYTAFNEENIKLPRSSRNMANKGTEISLNKAKKGDLLFFVTSKRSSKISHVGLIVSVKKGDIRFIHATTSRGVIISSMSENYWKNTFVKATKIL